MNVRPAAVAGYFYPDNARELRAAVLEHVVRAKPDGPVPKALIAPHAGYQYSGPVAGSAYALIAPRRDVIERVVLIGPSHRVGFAGLALPDASAFATPLGDVALDRAAIDRIRPLPQVIVSNHAHRQEHSIEVHLPFLQETLGPFSLVPLLTGEAAPSEVGAVIDALWGGQDTLIVVSSDLSHYHDYATASRMDAATSAAIEALRDEDIADDHACGAVAIRGLLWAARRRGLAARTLDLRNSGDTAGSKDRVVGYGAYAFDESAI
ncbi:MAG: AmmeMemoRadiSam system protein B [Vicinamibacterales bacterium]